MDPTDLRALHEQHMLALRRLHRAPGTIRSYRVYVGAFLRYLDESGLPCTFASLTPEAVGDAQDWLRARSVGRRDGATAEYTLVSRLKSFARWLWRRRLMSHDPLARLGRPSKPSALRTPYSEDEVRRMLWSASMGPSPLMERAMMLLAFDTGCRIGELCALRIGDLDVDKGLVLVRKSKNRRPRRVIVKVDQLPDGGPCLIALREWLAQRVAEPGVDTLFVNRNGDALSPDRARAYWHQLGESVNVPDAIPHRARHTHATELLAELPGGELHLRNRLGHISKEVLADYISISDPMAQDVANLASLSAKWNL